MYPQGAPCALWGVAGGVQPARVPRKGAQGHPGGATPADPSTGEARPRRLTGVDNTVRLVGAPLPAQAGLSGCAPRGEAGKIA